MEEEFRHLMRTGEPKDGRELDELMVVVAQNRFSRFSDAEVSALHTYLRTLPTLGPEDQP